MYKFYCVLSSSGSNTHISSAVPIAANEPVRTGYMGNVTMKLELIVRADD